MGRLGSRKSTNGCRTCKIRKIRCDEQRPTCVRCTSTGRKCDGYAETRLAPTGQRSELQSKLLARSLDLFAYRDRAETQAFQFFIDRILPGMTLVVDTDFWRKFVIQSAQADSAIWNATNAMSQLVRHLHGRSTFSDEDDNDNNSTSTNHHLALRWYSQSINELQRQMKRQLVWSSTCSITAVLYMCIECLLDNVEGAMYIYQQAMYAIGMLSHTRGVETTKQVNNPVNDSVMALFRHITASHGFQDPQQLHRPSTTTEMSLIDAKDALYGLIGDCHQFVCAVEQIKQYQTKAWIPGADLFYQQDHILDRLENWNLAAAAIEGDKSHPDYALAYACMRLGYLTYLIWVSTVLDMSETAFDQYLPEFEAMLNYAEAAINANGGEQPLFSFETRVIPLMSFVATRCRHPHMRRKAIELLYRGPRIENTRKAKYVIALSKRIIAIEESGAAEGGYLEYLDKPASLELPPEVDRLGWAKVVNEKDQYSQNGDYLRFGRWRQNSDNKWSLTSEIIKI